MASLRSRAWSPAMSFILISVAAIIIPASLSLWIIDSTLHAVDVDFTGYRGTIPPWRVLIAFILTSVVITYARKKKSLDRSGAIAASIVGFCLSLASYIYFCILLMFFISSSRATKFKAKQKVKQETDYKEGGQRNWIQVICNGGFATELAIIYMFDSGCRELPINFSTYYTTSWLNMMLLGAIACCNGDTWASEFGSVLGKGDPWLITTLRKVPRGTNGGVSSYGLLFSALGGLVIGLTYYIAEIFVLDASKLLVAPPQWPVILVGIFAGLIGSLIDSLLGATLQYSGYSKSQNCVVEVPADDVKKICGTYFMDNHSVNLLSSILTSILTPYFAFSIWRYY